MTARRRKSRSKKHRSVRHWRGTDIVVTYNGRVCGIDVDKDRAIRKALGKYETGSGFAFREHERDHTATVPEEDLPRVLRGLKKIRGVRVKRRVQKWVLCR